MDITFLTNSILFLAALGGMLFVPGYVLMRMCFPVQAFASLERIILAPALSFVIMTLALIITDRLGAPLDRTAAILTTASVIAVCCATGVIVRRFTRRRAAHTTSPANRLFHLTPLHTILLAALIILTVGIKGYYLVNTVFPTSTDLGHHLYWVAKAIHDHALPHYTAQEITALADGHYDFGTPVAMPDFIVGEHAVLAALFAVTGIPIISAFPSLFLFVLNIFTALTLFVLARRLFDRTAYGIPIAILTLLVAGPLWAISGAQAKFASGGVIGNIIGNLLIPTTFYFLLRALREKRPTFLMIAILCGTALAYTHHLSAFVFGYSIIFAIAVFVVCNPVARRYRDILRLVLHPTVIITLLIAIAWLVWIQPPSYLTAETVATSVGTPTKSTRIGIPFGQLPALLGEARFAIGLVGLLLIGGTLCVRRCVRRAHAPLPLLPSVYAGAIVVGWSGAILLMSTVPHLLHVNILSSRIVTYAAFPLAIACAYAVAWTVASAVRTDGTLRLPRYALSLLLAVVMTYLFASGMHDNATAMNPAPRTNRALQTFHAGTYAADTFGAHAERGDFWMLKDHNYITADTWLKIFFAYDYAYPLSRAYFARYESNPDRETCTLDMITDPTSDHARICFADLRVRVVLVATEQDAAQFLAHPDFTRIYQNNTLSMFVRNASL